MKSGLSRRQREALDAVRHWTQEHGCAPTVRELAELLGVASTATIHQHLTALEAKGYLARARYRHRSLQAQVPPRRPPTARRDDTAQVPLVGSIVAGRPLEAIEVLDDEALVEVPSSYLTTGEHFALRVNGESMIDDGIREGDLLLVRRQDRAANGQTVVALIDGEATVKRLYLHGAQAELRPANATMSSLFVPLDRLTIQGIVVSLLRRY